MAVLEGITTLHSRAILNHDTILNATPYGSADSAGLERSTPLPLSRVATCHVHDCLAPLNKPS